MKNRCALFPECRPLSEGGRAPPAADAGPPGERVRGRWCRDLVTDQSRWALAQIKIPRLCKFLGAEIPRRINTTRTASSSTKERSMELAFILRSVVVRSCSLQWNAQRAFANSLSRRSLASNEKVKSQKIRIITDCQTAQFHEGSFRTLFISNVFIIFN